MQNLTAENYLKAIFLLSSSDTAASTGKLAERLGVAPGTVTSMLKALAERGLAEYQPYEGVTLTEDGRKVALRVLRRHRLIECFLVATLGMTWDEVHEEAENMEHAVSDHLIDRIDAYLGNPKCDPHGDPIPQADGSLSAGGGEDLAAWPIGKRFRLVRVLDQSVSFLQYLSSEGLELGTVGEISEKSADAGVLTVIGVGEKGSAKTTLSTEAAKKIRVEAS